MLSTKAQFIAAAIIMAAGIVEAGVFQTWDMSDTVLVQPDQGAGAASPAKCAGTRQIIYS